MSRDHCLAAAAALSLLVAGITTATAQQLPNFKDDRRLPIPGQAAAPVADAAADAKRKADEDARRVAEAEDKRKADEDARRVAEAEAKRKADEDARQVADAEAKRRADEEARRTAEAEAKRKADEDARQVAEADAKRKADEEARQVAEAEAKRKADEDARRVAEAEAKRKADEDARRVAAAEAKRKSDEEALRSAEANAAREAQTAAASADAQRLLARGRQFLAGGDVASARLLLERAAGAGNPEAARELAASYDPAQLTRRGLSTVAADPAQQAAWTKRADEMQLKLDAETRTRAEADARRIASATDAKRTADEERARAVAAAQTAARIPAPATQPVAPPPVAAAIIPAPAPPPPAAAPQPAPAPVVAAPAPPPPAPVASIWPRLLGAITVPADTSAEAARYIARGRQEKATGDLNAARLFFERAADLKSPAGAVEMALTYDPEALREPAVAAVTSIRGEPAQARTWYQRAESLGAKGLAARIQALPAN